ncbi:MAG: hypothetical protein NTV30_10645 [Chloroflexi bacterium]|nr:hypothetical protein [Chloroflexota bacterium]
MNLKFWSNDKDKIGKNKWTADKQKLQVDLFCQLIYMAGIATSGISRSGLFTYAAQLPYVSACYFKRINVVAKAFNHDYSEACRIVGETTEDAEVKSLLLRFSGALASGEDMANFLEREAVVSSQTYGNFYERSLESLKKWADAYTAIIMTSAIVCVMAVVSMIIGNITISAIIGMCVLTVVVSLAGTWLIYKSAPKETRTHSLKIRSREQYTASFLFRYILPFGIFLAFLMIIRGSLGMSMIIMSMFLFPLGFISVIDDNKIFKRDSDIAGLLRSVGGISQAINATISESLGRIDFRSLGSIKKDVNLLYIRLQAGINSRLCWDRFAAETGSELISRSTRIFLDSIFIGGEPERVGNEVSSFAMKIVLLRAKRRMIDTGHLWLTTIMHFVLCSLVVFVYQIMVSFSALIEKVVPVGGFNDLPVAIPTFGVYGTDSPEMQLLNFMVISIVVVLAFANAFSIYFASGGHIYKLAFYLSITMALSGLSLLIVPSLVEIILIKTL